MGRMSFEAEVGRLYVETADGKIRRTGWVTDWDASGAAEDPDELCREAAAQIRAYLAGDRNAFELPLAPEGPPLDASVWAAMLEIPYGETWTYGEMARRVGSNPRVVGGACGRNPIPIVIPCHRVVGAGGKLTGFSGGDGVETKAWLLRHETRDTRLL